MPDDFLPHSSSLKASVLKRGTVRLRRYVSFVLFEVFELKRRQKDPHDQSSIVPPESMNRTALVAVLAVMSFLCCLAAGVAVFIHTAARDWQSGIASEVTIQIKPVPGVEIALEVEKAIDHATNFPGVRAAEEISEDALKELLKPWLGDSVDLQELPVPRLIVVDLESKDIVNLDALKRQIRQNVTGATLDDHRTWSQWLGAMANSVLVFGFVLLALMLFSTVLTVFFATSGAMGANRNTIEVLHLVGADRRYIIGQFMKHFLRQALYGSMIGGVCAAMVFFVINLFFDEPSGSGIADQLRAFSGGITFGAGSYVSIVVVMALVALTVAITSRFTAYRTLLSI